MLTLPSDKQIKSLLAESTTIAVVGMSPKSQRPSNSVAAYLIAQGYRVIPVNPGHKEILGLTCYPELGAIPESVDIVDIFRKSSEVGPVVNQAVDSGARAVWMQLGVINEEAAERAVSAGLLTVMDRCIKIEHSRLTP
ncbi:MAG: CoA-binding protein [Desulfofustis sp.]|nr:CoA-binding protein [Desulfofustis sp.]